ncbi:MAG: adenylate/guanylate cyclase domain-containing protein [Gammaproteobacteria bacterium]|nr:adenylate/guanylate cyclase domain-containing protein [Gammaproteobacteria bacterium]
MKRFESQLRLGSGIVLAVYVTQHLLNHAFGIVSIEAAEAYRKTVGAAFQTWPGLLLLYASILFHAIIALRSRARARQTCSAASKNSTTSCSRNSIESVQMGIGIHGGDAIVGTMGPPRTPLLTAVGDNINIAARLEAKAKDLDCDLIVSIATLEAEGIDYDREAVRELEVRGRDQRVRVGSFRRDQLPGSQLD